MDAPRTGGTREGSAVRSTRQLGRSAEGRRTSADRRSADRRRSADGRRSATDSRVHRTNTSSSASRQQQRVAGQPHPNPQPAQHRRRGRSRGRRRHDPLNVAALILFVVATLLAVMSVALPYWLTSSTGGFLYVGLLQTCLEISGREPVCYTPQDVSPEWILTFLFIVVGISGLIVAVIMCALTLIKGTIKYMPAVRLAGVVAIIFFNLAQILFPSAFGQDQIGGSAFQIPQNFKTYLSFAMFFLAHWATVAGELCAAQICRPRWQL